MWILDFVQKLYTLKIHIYNIYLTIEYNLDEVRTILICQPELQEARLFLNYDFFYNVHNKVEPTFKLPFTSFRFLRGQRLNTFSDVWTNQIRISVRNKGLPSPKLTYPWKLPKFWQRESPTPGRSQRSLKIGPKWKPSSKILKIESDWRSIHFIYPLKTNISIISTENLLV